MDEAGVAAHDPPPTMRLTFPALSLLFALGCKNTTPEPPSSPSQPATPTLPPGHPPLPPGHPPMGGGGGAGAGHVPPGAPEVERPAQGSLRWRDPARWQRQQPASSMRAAQYEVPGAGGAAAATLVVFYFGQGQGGAIEDNLQRWWGQFEQPDGRPSASVAQRETRTVSGMRVTVTSVTGRSAGGAMMGPAQAPQDNQMLLGAIVETTEGPWFFKLTGARATVEAARPAFDELLTTLRMGS